MAGGQATDAELERLRAKLGQRVDIKEPPHLTEVTRDAIRHWAWATGDRSPLYLDEKHAENSDLGGLTAPPCMLYAFSRISIGYRGGLPGVHSMFGGSWWRWKALEGAGEGRSADFGRGYVQVARREKEPLCRPHVQTAFGN
jgi:hypothetical protein